MCFYGIISELTSKYWFCTKMLMITVLYIACIGKVMSDVRRYDNGYEADFRVINKGRLYPILMYFRNIDFKECSLNCIKYLDCVSFNFNFDTKECELADEDFDEYEADTDALYWSNFGTPQRIDGGFSDWMNGSCSAKCGGGVRNQFRTCTNPEPKFGGDKCIGKMTRTIACNNHLCPINGGLSDWVSSSCSVPCGGGQLTQTRTCTNPVPQYGGADCIGDKQRTLTCNSQPCPINGGLSDWVSSSCPVPCGGGQLTQTRTCTNPVPKYGGADCIGDKQRTLTCNSQPCPINGQWTSWTPTSQCSKSCNGGQITEARYCTNPSPQHGGTDCSGANTRTASCNSNCCSGRKTTKGTCCWTGCAFGGCLDMHKIPRICA